VWRDGYITAASTPPEAAFGFVFDHSRITGASPDVRAFLGRPWRAYAQVTWLHTQMSAVVRPEGWHNWDRPEREKTTRYEEFDSSGDGAAAARRVGWAHPLSRSAVAAYTVRKVLGGTEGWNPRGVRAYPSAVRALDEPTPPPPGPVGQ
jgi:pectinesterase